MLTEEVKIKCKTYMFYQNYGELLLWIYVENGSPTRTEIVEIDTFNIKYTCFTEKTWKITSLNN